MFNMYNNPYGNQAYMNDLQNMRDRIDRQMQMVAHTQQPNQQTTPITQNFQLAPTQNTQGLKYVENVDDVKKELVFNDTLFITKDLSKLWLKDAAGNIKTFELNEVIEMDEKDRKIAELTAKIESLEKEKIVNAKYDNANVDDTTTIEKSTSISANKSSKK